MNAVAVMYVNSHLADLHAEAQRLKKIIGADSDPVVPQLKNYPYGG